MYTLMCSNKNVQWTVVHLKCTRLSKILSCWLCEPTFLKVDFIHLNYTARRYNTIEQNLMPISYLILTTMAISASSVHEKGTSMESTISLWRENFSREYWNM